MKKLLFLLTVILLSCSQPGSDRTFTTEDGTPPHPIVGTWERSGNRFDFYTNGEFIYYEYPENIIVNEGDYYFPTDDTIFLQDSYSGATQTYIFEILPDIPEEGETTLRWSTIAYPDLLVDWLRVE